MTVAAILLNLPIPLSPYVLLAALTEADRKNSRDYFFATIGVVIVGSLAYGWFYLSGARTNGWDFFITPFAQGLVGLLLLGCFRIWTFFRPKTQHLTSVGTDRP
jgi:hypothetical protein